MKPFIDLEPYLDEKLLARLKAAAERVSCSVELYIATAAVERLERGEQAALMSEAEYERFKGMLLALVLAGCTIVDGKVGPLVNLVMIWQQNWPYSTADISLVEESGGRYMQYASLQDGNVGHYPPSSYAWWVAQGLVK